MNFDKPIVLSFDRLVMKEFLDDHQFILIDSNGIIEKSNNTIFDLSTFVNQPLEKCLPLLQDYFSAIKENPLLPLEINCLAFTYQNIEAIYDVKLTHLTQHKAGDHYLIHLYNRTEHYKGLQLKQQKKIDAFLNKEVLQRQTETIQKQNEEIKSLIKEAHHRIKNNLQIINSLIGFQIKDSSDFKLKQILIEVQNRIHSMALLHECLYNSQNLREVNVKTYIEKLVKDLIKSYSVRKKIIYKIIADPAELDSKTLVSIGLLINELLSNSIKHGLTESENAEIDVHFENLKDNHYRLTVRDNGIGIPKDIFTKPLNSLGIELILAFSHQLDGKISILNVPGTSIQIEFSEVDQNKK